MTGLPDLSPGGRLGRILVDGKTPTGLSVATCTGQLTVTTSEVTTLELVVADPLLVVLRSQLFELGRPVTYGPLALTVESIEIADASGIPTLTVEAMSAGAQKARGQRGELVRRDISPSQYVAIGAAAVGLRSVVQPTPTRASITRAAATKGSPGETEYDVWQRLAGEVGFICFEVAGTVYFAHPTWLVAHLPAVTVDWTRDDRVLVIPNCRAQANDPTQPVTVNLSVTDSLADSLLPGFAAKVAGVGPPFDGAYVITSTTIPLDDTSPCTVAAATPVDPAATAAASGASIKRKAKAKTSGPPADTIGPFQ